MQILHHLPGLSSQWAAPVRTQFLAVQNGGCSFSDSSNKAWEDMMIKEKQTAYKLGSLSSITRLKGLALFV